MSIKWTTLSTYFIGDTVLFQSLMAHQLSDLILSIRLYGRLSLEDQIMIKESKIIMWNSIG